MAFWETETPLFYHDQVQALGLALKVNGYALDFDFLFCVCDGMRHRVAHIGGDSRSNDGDDVSGEVA